MRKKLLAGVVTLSLGVVPNASAISIDITSMDFGSISAASGTIHTDSIGDTFNGVFFNAPWVATTAAVYNEPGSHTWAGTSPLGLWSYNFTLTSGQYAWGLQFDWSASSYIPVLHIMDCPTITLGSICTGIGTPMQTGPFPGQDPAFNGVVTSVVPVPAAIWLFGSGLIGLAGYARHRRMT